MYVCICNSITEKQVRAAIEQGARSVRDLNRQLGVGGECGKCTCIARQLVKQAFSEEALARAVPA